MTVRLAVNVMQSLALFGLMSAKWPETFEQISSSLQIFVLDMKNLNLNCLLGGNSVLSYVVSTVVFPLVLLWLVICHAGSHLICSRSVACTAGNGLSPSTPWGFSFSSGLAQWLQSL